MNNLDFNHFLEVRQGGINSIGINRTLIIYPNFGSAAQDGVLRVSPGDGLLSTVNDALYIEPVNPSIDGKIVLSMSNATSPFGGNPTGGSGTLTIVTTYDLLTF